MDVTLGPELCEKVENTLVKHPSPGLGAEFGLRHSTQSLPTMHCRDACAWPCVILTSSLICSPAFPAWPQLKYITMNLSGIQSHSIPSYYSQTCSAPLTWIPWDGALSLCSRLTFCRAAKLLFPDRHENVEIGKMTG